MTTAPASRFCLEPPNGRGRWRGKTQNPDSFESGLRGPQRGDSPKAATRIIQQERTKAMADTQIDVKRNQTTTSARRAETRPAAFDPFQAFRHEMDLMFDRFWRGGFGLPSFRRTAEPEAFWPAEGGFAFSAPAIDFAEDEKAYHLTAELPGLSDKDINLMLSDDLLTITGEKREEKEGAEKNYHYSERRFGSFRRAVQLPQHIDRDKIEAHFKNGVLHVTLPKTPDAMQRQKKIEIKAQ
jgi:HSP20 family protein